MTGKAVLPKRTWNKQDVIAVKVLAVSRRAFAIHQFYSVVKQRKLFSLS